MPRETIRQHGAFKTSVHVGWDNAGQGVQIGVELADGDAILVNGVAYDSVWTDNLTEDDINRITKALHRAKRKAFPKR